MPPQTPDHRIAIGQANRGRVHGPHSDERRAKIGAGVSAAWTPERRQALAEANRLRTGTKHPPEFGAAIRARLLGHVVSEETRAKSRAISLGNQNLRNAPIKGECVYCFGPAQTHDHVIPRGRLGWDASGNIVLACHSCNASKGQRTPDEWLAAMTDGRRDHNRARTRRRTMATRP